MRRLSLTDCRFSSFAVIRRTNAFVESLPPLVVPTEGGFVADDDLSMVLTDALSSVAPPDDDLTDAGKGTPTRKRRCPSVSRDEPTGGDEDADASTVVPEDNTDASPKKARQTYQWLHDILEDLETGRVNMDETTCLPTSVLTYRSASRKAEVWKFFLDLKQKIKRKTSHGKRASYAPIVEDKTTVYTNVCTFCLRDMKNDGHLYLPQSWMNSLKLMKGSTSNAERHLNTSHGDEPEVIAFTAGKSCAKSSAGVLDSGKRKSPTKGDPVLGE
jgi:hypothetical protein